MSGHAPEKKAAADALAQKDFSVYMMGVYTFMARSLKEQRARIIHVRPIAPALLQVFPTAAEFGTKIDEMRKRQAGAKSANQLTQALAERIGTLLCEATIDDPKAGFRIWGYSQAASVAEVDSSKSDHFIPLNKKHLPFFHPSGFNWASHCRDDVAEAEDSPRNAQTLSWRDVQFTCNAWDPRYIIHKWSAKMKDLVVPALVSSVPSAEASAERDSDDHESPAATKAPEPPQQQEETQPSQPTPPAPKKKAKPTQPRTNRNKGKSAVAMRLDFGGAPVVYATVDAMVRLLEADHKKQQQQRKVTDAERARLAQVQLTEDAVAAISSWAHSLEEAIQELEHPADEHAIGYIKEGKVRRARENWPRVLPLVDVLDEKQLTLALTRRLAFFPDDFAIDMARVVNLAFGDVRAGWKSEPLVAAILVHANADYFSVQGIQRHLNSHDNQGNVNGASLRSDTVHRAIEQWANGPVNGRWDAAWLLTEQWAAASALQSLAECDSPLFGKAWALFQLANLTERVLRWRNDATVPQDTKNGRTCVMSGGRLAPGTTALAVDVLLTPAYLPPEHSGGRAYTFWVQPVITSFDFMPPATAAAGSDPMDVDSSVVVVAAPPPVTEAAAPATKKAKPRKRKAPPAAPAETTETAATPVAAEPPKKRTKRVDVREPIGVKAKESWDAVPPLPSHVLHREARWHALQHRWTAEVVVRRPDDWKQQVEDVRDVLSGKTSLKLWVSQHDRLVSLTLADLIWLFIRPASEHPAQVMDNNGGADDLLALLPPADEDSDDDLLACLPKAPPPPTFSLPQRVAAFDGALDRLRNMSQKSLENPDSRQGIPHLKDLPNLSGLEASHPIWLAWAALFVWS